MWDHREAPADVDIEDDEQLRAALEYVYGAAAPWTNIDGIVENEFHDPTKTEGDNRRYWLNQPAKRADRLFDPIAHKALERTGLRPADGTSIVMGFDGSENRDSTALIGWTVADTPHRFTIGLWERPKGVGYEDWHIPRGEVDAAVYRAFRDFTVKYMVCDPAYWQSELSGWDREFGEDVVVKTNTRDTRIMVEAVQRYTVALAEGRFTHDGDPDVQRHIDNMAPRDTRAGIVPIKATRNEKIDAGMATLLGFWGLSRCRRQDPARGSSRSPISPPRTSDAVPSRPKRRHHVPHRRPRPRGGLDGANPGMAQHRRTSQPPTTAVVGRSSVRAPRIGRKRRQARSESRRKPSGFAEWRLARMIDVVKASQILGKTPQAVTADCREGRLAAVEDLRHVRADPPLMRPPWWVAQNAG